MILPLFILTANKLCNLQVFKYIHRRQHPQNLRPRTTPSIPGTANVPPCCQRPRRASMRLHVSIHCPLQRHIPYTNTVFNANAADVSGSRESLATHDSGEFLTVFCELLCCCCCCARLVCVCLFFFFFYNVLKLIFCFC